MPRYNIGSGLKFSPDAPDSSYHSGHEERVLDLGRIYVPEFSGTEKMQPGSPLPLSDDELERQINRSQIQDTLKRLDRLSRQRQARKQQTIRRRCI